MTDLFIQDFTVIPIILVMKQVPQLVYLCSRVRVCLPVFQVLLQDDQGRSQVKEKER